MCKFSFEPGVSLKLILLPQGENPTTLDFVTVRFFTKFHPAEKTESRCTKLLLYRKNTSLFKNMWPLLGYYAFSEGDNLVSLTERTAWFWLREMGKGRVFSNAHLEAGRAGSSLGNKPGTLENAGLVGQLSEERCQLWEHIRSCQHSPEP